MNQIAALYQDLVIKYGNPVVYWPRWCARKRDQDLREEIALGTILVQRTTWHNAELALKNLKLKNLLSIEA